MAIGRIMPAGFIIVGSAALAFAGTAQADPPLLDGTYNAAIPGKTGIWTVTSDCATEGCQANISSDSGWSGVATLTGGQWNLTVDDNPNGLICPDGRRFTSEVVYTIDATSLIGTAAGPDQCQTPVGWSSNPITLTKA
jgi:hypothetical protein